jgi:hypothetical protein
MSELSERMRGVIEQYKDEDTQLIEEWAQEVAALEADRAALIAHVIAYGKTEAVRWPDELEETYQALSPELRVEIEASDAE